MCARIADGRGPFWPSSFAVPLLSRLLFWVGPGRLFPSHNCHPTQSFVLRDVQGLPFVSLDTRCPPSSLGLLPPFCVRLSRRFFTALTIFVSPTYFLLRGLISLFSFSSPPLSVFYLAVSRILFVLRTYIPGEMYAQSGIPFTVCSLFEMDSNIPKRVPKVRSVCAVLGRFNSDEFQENSKGVL